MGFQVEITPDHILLADDEGEIVYWDKQEWVDDPQLTINIAVAIHNGHLYGTTFLRNLLRKR